MKYLKRNVGLTLIEVIISLAIFSIIFLSFMSMFSSSYINILSMGNKTVATRIAQEYMDQYYEGLTPSLPVQENRYYIDSEIEEYSDNLNKITIIVTFSDGKHSSSITALVPEGGI